MSRIGKLPIEIPEKITVNLENGQVEISNDKNQNLSIKILEGIQVDIKDNEIKLTPQNDKKQTRSNWGTLRSLLWNAIEGLTKGFLKTLLLKGVGYRINEQDKNLKLELGFSHSISYKKPESIEFEIEGNNKLIVRGYDKSLVGQVAAKIRKFRPVEPYKGRGFRYEDEIVRRKAGKKAVAVE